MKTDPFDSDFDFGFTLEDDPSPQITTKSEEATEALRQLRAMIEPLLKNLEKNPEKTMINWPNRAEKVKEFRSKLDKFVEEKSRQINNI